MEKKNCVSGKIRIMIGMLMLIAAAVLPLSGDDSIVFASARARFSDEFILPDSDTRYYSEEDICIWMSADDARIARNEIFARLGRKFKDKELQRYFNSCSWYNGTVDPDVFDKDYAVRLNRFEKANVTMLKKLEKKLREETCEKNNMKDRSGNTCYPPRYIREWTEEYIIYASGICFDKDDLLSETISFDDDSVQVLVWYRNGCRWIPYNFYDISRWTLEGYDYEFREADIAPWNSPCSTEGWRIAYITEEDAELLYD